MKLRKFIFRIAMFSLLVGLSSCAKEIDGYGIANVFVVSKEAAIGSDNVVYALRIQAEGTKSISSISVETPEGGVEELTPENSMPTYCETTTDFVEDAPAQGNYIVTFNFVNGETYTLTKTLNLDFILPATIKNITGSTFGSEIQWNAVEGVREYQVWIKDYDDNPIFWSYDGYNSSIIGSNTTSYSITDAKGTWSDQIDIYEGNTYIVEIHAFKADSNGTLQSQSIASRYFQWKRTSSN